MSLGSNTRLRARIEAAKQPSPRERAATIAYFATPYTVLLGLAYLWAYWSTFGISILEFLTLGDIFRLAAFPVAAVALVAGVGALLGEFTPITISEDRKLRIALTKGRVFVLMLLVTIFMFGLAAFTSSPNAWAFAVVLLGLPASAAFVYLFRGVPLVPTWAVGVLSVVLGMLPFMAGYSGAAMADDVRTGERFSAVVSQVLGLPSTSGKLEDVPRFLGHAGERYFLWLPATRAAVILDKDQAKTLIISRVRLSEPHASHKRPGSTR